MKTKQKIILPLKNKEDLTATIIKMVKSGATHEDICSHIESNLKHSIVNDLVRYGVSEKEALKAYADVAPQVLSLIQADVAAAMTDETLPEGVSIH